MDDVLKKTVFLDNQEHLDYFESCARIRDISVTALLNRVLKTVADDQLVLAILDDESARNKQPGEYRFRRLE